MFFILVTVFYPLRTSNNFLCFLFFFFSVRRNKVEVSHICKWNAVKLKVTKHHIFQSHFVFFFFIFYCLFFILPGLLLLGSALKLLSHVLAIFVLLNCLVEFLVVVVYDEHILQGTLFAFIALKPSILPALMKLLSFVHGLV